MNDTNNGISSASFNKGGEFYRLQFSDIARQQEKQES